MINYSQTQNQNLTIDSIHLRLSASPDCTNWLAQNSFVLFGQYSIDTSGFTEIAPLAWKSNIVPATPDKRLDNCLVLH